MRCTGVGRTRLAGYMAKVKEAKALLDELAS